MLNHVETWKDLCCCFLMFLEYWAFSGEKNISIKKIWKREKYMGKTSRWQFTSIYCTSCHVDFSVVHHVFLPHPNNLQVSLDSEEAVEVSTSLRASCQFGVPPNPTDKLTWSIWSFLFIEFFQLEMVNFRQFESDFGMCV